MRFSKSTDSTNAIILLMYVVDMFILKVATFPKYFIEHFGFAREKHEVMCT